jgi:DNA repair photolyase
LADGRQLPIAELRVGDRIIGTERRGTYRHYVETSVLAHWSTIKPAHRVTLEDGTKVVASGDHRFLTHRGWKHVIGAMAGRDRRPHLTTNDELLGFGRTVEALAVCAEYRRGYLTGMIRGDANLKTYDYQRAGRTNGRVHRFRLALADEEGLHRTHAYLMQEGVSTDWFDFSPVTDTRRRVRAIRTQAAASVDRITQLIAWPDEPTQAWERGFLAGIFDAEGSRSQDVLRISNADDRMLERTRAAFAVWGFDTVLEDWGLPNSVRSVRLRGGLREHLRFLHLVDPAIRRKCSVEGIAVKSDAALRVVSIEALELEMPMYDITTGTGDFIANGVISHNCFARRTHEWLEFDSGRDFDSQIVVKTNLVDVLRKELARPSWQREHVALGTNTDPYQRAEGRYRLMPGVIDALADSGTPFSILTKGTLLRRDIPLLVEAAKKVPIGLGVSMAIWDDALHHALEPGVPTPKARLDLVTAVTDAGLPCGVFLAPVLPGLTDGVEALDAALGAIAAAGATGVTVIPLHLRPGAREWFMAWLRDAHPELLPRYEQLYARRAYVPAEYRTWLSRRVAPLLTKHGLDRQSGGSARGAEDPTASDAITTGVPGDEEVGFPAGSLPTDGMPGVRPKGELAPLQRPAVLDAAEQLSLL